MDVSLIARVLRLRRTLRARERWTHEEIVHHREAALADLRRFALERSPFYQRFHRGSANRPLSELPILTKAELMASFDEVATDDRVRLAPIRGFLDAVTGLELYDGRFWVARTAGSTGNPGVFVWDKTEWSTVLASYARAQDWAGIDARLTRRTRLAVVSSRVPWHQSALVGMSVDTPFLPVRRFDATEPVDRIVDGLNDWRPENLICYASMARVLADEQVAGRLRIRPRAVMCSSEPLTPETRRRIRVAFGTKPFNVYAATETAGIASECEMHRLHLFEDLVIVEVLDENNRPVPPGTTGAKLVVTVLFSRTQPLIRYEMSDTIALSSEACPCGRPFGLVAAVEGRIEDVLALPAADGGSVSVHPNTFHMLLEALPVTAWQVEQLEDGLLIRLLNPSAPIDVDGTTTQVSLALSRAGAVAGKVQVAVVDKLTRTALGKAPLVKALRPVRAN
jgi:phenylacetate-CoA ligase